MTDHRHADPEVLVDMTRTIQGQGRMAGAVRVESEFASALLERHPTSVVPVSWSSADEQFVELDRDTAARYLSQSGMPGEDAAGPPLESTRRPDPSRRRILLVTGAGWLSNLKLLHGLMRTRRAIDAELHVVVHDLIHLLFPQWAPREEALKSSSAHEAILAGADRVLVYSDSTARDIADVAERRGIQIRDIRRMALGTTVAPEIGDPGRASLGLESLTDRPFVLYVSSVAARKNHLFISQVWTRLAAELGSRLPRLIFVGRAPADQEAMMERLGRDPALADHLVHVSGANDAQLAWLYQHCLFTVFPSLYEGWGLPVAESLAAGKVCLASNASSIPEVGLGATPVLDPLDIRAWCETVRTLVVEPAAFAAAERNVRETYRATTWLEATERLWNAVVPPLDSPPQRPALHISSPPGPQQLSGLLTMLEPWRPVRTALGVISAHRRRVGVQLAEVPPHGLRLDLAISSQSPSILRVEIEINGLVIDGCVLNPGQPSVRRFDLPRDVLLCRGILEIVAVVRPVTGQPASEDTPLSFEAVSAAPLTRDEETTAVDARRDAWRMDEVVHFSAGSRSLALLKRGWDEAARWGVWTREPVVELSFRPLPQPSEPVVMRAIVRGFVPPAQPELDVDVLVNRTKVATWSFRHPTDFSFVERSVVIPTELISDGFVHMQLSMPGVRSPRELGMSQDERRLGVGLVRAHCTTRRQISGDTDGSPWRGR